MKVYDKICIFCFFPIINKYFFWQNVLYFPNDLRTSEHIPWVINIYTSFPLNIQISNYSHLPSM